MILADHGLVEKLLLQNHVIEQSEHSDASDLAGNSNGDCTCDDVILIDHTDMTIKYPLVLNTYKRISGNSSRCFYDAIWQPPKFSGEPV